MYQLNEILYVSEPVVNQSSTIARAISLAKNNQAHLTFIEVIPDQFVTTSLPLNGPSAAELMDKIKDKRREELQNLVSPYQPPMDTSYQILAGTKFLEVIRAVLRGNYDLVIKPSENPDWIDRLFGSDDMHLLRKCPCPVWLTKPKGKTKYKHILAAVDFKPLTPDPTDKALNESILTLSSFIALTDSANLHIVHAWDSPEAGFASVWAENPEQIESQIRDGARLRHKAGMENLVDEFEKLIGSEAYSELSIKSHLPMGSARKAVPAMAKEIEADLVVIGTVARTGIPGFIIGNTAESILDQLTCSVLALKPPGFVSPVTLV